MFQDQMIVVVDGGVGVDVDEKRFLAVAGWES
jgi:hypothetical protein